MTTTIKNWKELGFDGGVLMADLEIAKYIVYTKLEHVSSSGMTRYISCYIALPGGDIKNITWHVSKLLGRSRSDKYNGGIKVSGCGSDMGFEVVYNLSMRLFCSDKYDHDAAYKLKQRWL